MSNTRLSYEVANKIVTLWLSGEHKCLEEVMRAAGLKAKSIRTLRRYRRRAEELIGVQLPSLQPKQLANVPRRAEHYNNNKKFSLICFSDAHFRANCTPASFYILLDLIKVVKPKLIICNGDALDGASVGRWPRRGWDYTPNVMEEYEACRWHLDQITSAAARNTTLFFTKGNHDERYENYISANAPSLEGMPGTTLDELFPDWLICSSLHINNTLMVKHDWHGGIHAAYNNTLKSGRSCMTGHTHRLTVREYTDLNGTRYGIEDGMLCMPHGPQFHYANDNPVNWQEGFMVLTVDQESIYPERVEVINRQSMFRGKVYKAKK